MTVNIAASDAEDYIKSFAAVFDSLPATTPQLDKEQGVFRRNRHKEKLKKEL